MKPRWFLALAYLLMGLGWLQLGLLGTTPNEDWWHFLAPLVQAGFALLALLGALLLPSLTGLLLHWTALAGITFASAALTVYAIDTAPTFASVHAAQTLGLLVATWYALQWWLASGGVRYARRLAAGFLLASLGALAMVALEFLGQGHPYQVVQRPYTAAGDALVGAGLLLAAWMGGVAALTLKTPEPIIKP